MTDTTRAAFEAWAKSEGYPLDRASRDYFFPSTRGAYRAWHAGIASQPKPVVIPQGMLRAIPLTQESYDLTIKANDIGNRFFNRLAEAFEPPHDVTDLAGWIIGYRTSKITRIAALERENAELRAKIDRLVGTHEVYPLGDTLTVSDIGRGTGAGFSVIIPDPLSEGIVSSAPPIRRGRA